ncbi:MAG: caspase family protein [Proteobacteria bacterium]|nr:caspase family protein [Pseudomonadota bacterium]
MIASLFALSLSVSAQAASVGEEVAETAAVELPEAATPATNPRRRAVLVGANDGGTALQQLQYAEIDAERVAEVLENLGGFAPEDILLISSPSADELSATLGDLALQGSQDLFVFYYSGHADTRGLQLGEEIYGYERLKADMRGIEADVRLGVLDACRSGAVTTVKGATVEAPFLIEDGTEARGEAWIAASAAFEDAQESPLLGGSFFTYYLLSGLRGAADSGDGWVSLSEAYKYAYDRTVARTAGTLGGTQHPAYNFQMEGNGELQLTEVRRATARLQFPAAHAGTVTVLRLPERTPIAEIAMSSGRASELAIPPGRYLLRKRADQELQEVRITLTEGGVVMVDRWGDAQVEVASVKGGEEDGRRYLKIPLNFDPSNFPKINPWKSAALAGGASALLPGAGQVYDKRLGDGVLFFTAAAVLNGAGWGLAEKTRGGLASRIWPGPNVFTWLGTATYFWSINDAAWGVHQREDFRPRTGVMLGAETSWGHSLLSAESMGVSIDVVPVPGFAIGLDRAGALPGEDEVRVSYGGRITLGPELDRARPEFVMAAGMYSTHPLPRDVPSHLVQSDVPEAVYNPYFASGAAIRWYLTPRYFVRAEARLESTNLRQWRPRWSGGIGAHIGGKAPTRPNVATPLEKEDPE